MMTVVIGRDEKLYVQNIYQSRVVAEKGGFFGCLVPNGFVVDSQGASTRIHYI